MILDSLKETIGRGLARYLNKPVERYHAFSAYDVTTLEQIMLPGDILLVEGDTRVSKVIKYLTQSTWSHSAFYAGAATKLFTPSGEPRPLIEADTVDGVIASPLSRYRSFNIRICRPVNLSDADRDILVDRMIGSIGFAYDLKHIWDLARYLILQQPLTRRWRRRLLAFGSGDPTRAICSTIIAECFQEIRYPILPEIEKKVVLSGHHYHVQEILHNRHHNLFTPRDFDVSPYFQIVKPTIERGFDYRDINYQES